MDETWNIERVRNLLRDRLDGRRFIVVSNREPFFHRHRADGTIECVRPASGMATALHPILMATGGTWIAHGSGSADREVVDERDCVMVPPEEPTYKLRRVWLDREVERGFYYGFSNECLWPLCHITFTKPEFRAADWQAYREANSLFADSVLEEAEGEKALVFIQDYHFCLLPRMLRERGAGRIVCAQFWHIPWPNREVFRALPWGEELLDGLLGNDLLAFHIHYHCQNFLDAVDRGIEARVDTDRSEITRHGHTTKIRPFPISIDFASANRMGSSPETAREMDGWLTRFPGLRGRRIVASIERLDYTKGIPQRLAAIELFLEQSPQWRGKVCFVQIAVPSRDDLASYKQEQARIDELTARINERFGAPDWQPIYLLKEHHNEVKMAALHRMASVFMVTPLHDGMNLVAKEHLAARSDERGALILSLFTGASRELGQAIGVNPYDIESIARAIGEALAMSPRRRVRRMRLMREQVAHQNVFRWAGRILNTLLRVEQADEDDD